MITRILNTAVVIGAALLAAFAAANESSTIPRIGVLVPVIANSPFEEGLREGLRDLGYVESRDVIIDWRRSPQTAEALRTVAKDLLKSNVSLIVATGSRGARAALEASGKIPVVFTSGDPVAAGFVSSLAKPGGNATGVSVLSSQMRQKGLEILRELAPRARRILYIINSSNPTSAQDRDAAQVAAESLGVQIVTVNARNVGELDTALHALQRGRLDGLLVSGDFFLFEHSADIARAARKARLPAIFAYRESHDVDVLVSYGPSLKQTMPLVAGYVDKILKGATPADLPVEQLSTYELIIDLRVARELGIDVPQTLLLRADEVLR